MRFAPAVKAAAGELHEQLSIAYRAIDDLPRADLHDAWIRRTPETPRNPDAR